MFQSFIAKVKVAFPFLAPLKRWLEDNGLLAVSHKGWLWPKLMADLSKQKSQMFFVQIGANDGLQMDPLHDSILAYNWSGLLVEPMPGCFARLKTTYQDHPGLILEQIAIAEFVGESTIFFVADYQSDERQHLAPLLSSLSKETLLKTLNSTGLTANPIQSQKVPCNTLDGIFQQHDICEIDIFVVDVEGYDYKVLKQLDFSRFKPSIIQIEFVHLQPIEQQQTLELLSAQGYETRLESRDLIACLRSNKALLKRMSQSRVRV